MGCLLEYRPLGCSSSAAILGPTSQLESTPVLLLYHLHLCTTLLLECDKALVLRRTPFLGRHLNCSLQLQQPIWQSFWPRPVLHGHAIPALARVQ